MKIKIATVLNTGIERTNNEDAFVVCPDLSLQDWKLDKTPQYISLNNYGSLLVVADGMGGANAGEVASSIATNSIQQTFSKENIEEAYKDNNIEGLLRQCIKEANEAICDRTQKDPDTFGMGTTIVVCWIIDNQAHIAWCGDSRCYIYNPLEGLKQLTKDHSLVQELVDMGEITEDEAFTHPDNNIITNGLGDADSQCIPDIVTNSVSPNDIILLCSDGLCGYSTNDEIEDVIEKNSSDITKCLDRLLKLALNAGGFDNICIVMASLLSDERNDATTPSPIQRFQSWIKRRCTHMRALFQLIPNKYKIARPYIGYPK